MPTRADPTVQLRRAAENVTRAETERNRLLRQLRSQRVPITQLSEAAGLSVGSVYNKTRASVLVSIGYEGKSPDELFALLEDNGVLALVDVRQQAMSRKAGFAKRAWSTECQARVSARSALATSLALPCPSSSDGNYRSHCPPNRSLEWRNPARQVPTTSAANPRPDQGAHCRLS